MFASVTSKPKKIFKNFHFSLSFETLTFHPANKLRPLIFILLLPLLFLLVEQLDLKLHFFFKLLAIDKRLC